MSRVSRRRFLKLAGTGLTATVGAACFPARAQTRDISDAPPPPLWETSPIKLGRVTAQGLSVRGGPGADYAEWGRLQLDDVVTVFGQVEGEALQRHNAMWCNIGGGYVYSSFLQPVVEVYNPVEEVGGGFWGQVTLPYVDARDAPREGAPVNQRLYCHSVLWARERAEDADGRSWYRLDSRRARNLVFWVPADTVRRVSEAEFAPIRPEVQDKRIVVDLGAQQLTAYEEGQVMLEQRISSGARFIARAAGLDYRTRPGRYRVTSKQPSLHMVGGTDGLDAYDYPGVPWVIFFNYTGLAIHGTYWHNDFGRPRSHGCVHVPPAVGQWLYRWTAPRADHGDFQVSTHLLRPGTAIVVR